MSSWNLSWIVCSEIFPVKVRSFCLVWTTCAQWLGQFIVVYSTPYMMANIGYGTFLFFGSMTVIAFGFVFFVIPETKGVSLEDMDVLWEGNKGFARQKRKHYEEVISARHAERTQNLEKEEHFHVDQAREAKV